MEHYYYFDLFRVVPFERGGDVGSSPLNLCYANHCVRGMWFSILLFIQLQVSHATHDDVRALKKSEGFIDTRSTRHSRRCVSSDTAGRVGDQTLNGMGLGKQSALSKARGRASVSKARGRARDLPATQRGRSRRAQAALRITFGCDTLFGIDSYFHQTTAIMHHSTILFDNLRSLGLGQSSPASA
jgi:hypothetical protein